MMIKTLKSITKIRNSKIPNSLKNILVFIYKNMAIRFYVKRYPELSLSRVLLDLCHLCNVYQIYSHDSLSINSSLEKQENQAFLTYKLYSSVESERKAKIRMIKSNMQLDIIVSSFNISYTLTDATGNTWSGVSSTNVINNYVNDFVRYQIDGIIVESIINTLNKLFDMAPPYKYAFENFEPKKEIKKK